MPKQMLEVAFDAVMKAVDPVLQGIWMESHALET